MTTTTTFETNPVLNAIASRKSVRHFLPKAVALEDIQTILRASGRAPSGSNIQPWQVHVVMGKKRDELAASLVQTFNDKVPEQREYNYYPQNWRDPYLARRRENGWGLYNTLGIKKGDSEAMKTQHAQNYEFFGAPVVLFIVLDDDMEQGSWLDCGMFIQNIMIAACALGLSTCPQAALVNFPNLVREHLSIGQNKKIVCGIALGYEDESHIVNTFQATRIGVDEFTTYHVD